MEEEELGISLQAILEGINPSIIPIYTRDDLEIARGQLGLNRCEGLLPISLGGDPSSSLIECEKRIISETNQINSRLGEVIKPSELGVRTVYESNGPIPQYDGNINIVDLRLLPSDKQPQVESSKSMFEKLYGRKGY